MDQIEQNGRTVTEAVQRVLAERGLRQEDVEVEVLDEGSRGVLGLGARDARVRITLRQGRSDTVRSVTEELLTLMGFRASVTAGEGPEGIRVDIAGENLGPLIGRNGHTLGAVETLAAVIAGRKLGAPVRIELDVAEYRNRRQQALQDLARRTAERVARYGREIALNPMDARDRRIIHMALQDHPVVITASRGEGEDRRVVVLPRAKPASGEYGEREEAVAGGQAPLPETHPSEAEPASQAAKTAGRGRANSRRFDQPSKQVPRSRGSARGARLSRQQERPNTPTRWARKPHPSGPAPRGSGRPDGLPVDAELEAEIEAHLAKEREKHLREGTSIQGQESGASGSAPTPPDPNPVEE